MTAVDVLARRTAPGLPGRGAAEEALPAVVELLAGAPRPGRARARRRRWRAREPSWPPCTTRWRRWSAAGARSSCGSGGGCVGGGGGKGRRAPRCLSAAALALTSDNQLAQGTGAAPVAQARFRVSAQTPRVPISGRRSQGTQLDFEVYVDMAHERERDKRCPVPKCVLKRRGTPVSPQGPRTVLGAWSWPGRGSTCGGGRKRPLEAHRAGTQPITELSRPGPRLAGPTFRDPQSLHISSRASG